MTDKIAFLGAGKLARALLKGLLKTPQPFDFSASVRRPESLAELRSLFPHVEATLDNRSILKDARYVILGVKPHYALGLIAELKDAFENGATLISLCARVPLARLREALGSRPVGLVRLMPNTACETRDGLLGISTEGREALNPQLKGLFSQIGRVEIIEEEEMDVFTVLGASVPAFFLQMARSLAEAAEKSGLDAELSERCVAQVLKGVGSLLAEGSLSTAERIAQIATPGGVTAEGLARLGEAGLREASFTAFESALVKCRSLKL